MGLKIIKLIFMGSVKNVRKNNQCHDCDKKIKINDNEIKNGHLLVYNDNGKRITVLKCKKCFEKNPGLINFRKCEVYSRIVGYLRPVQHWNRGKQEEFRGREEYKL